MVTVRSAVEGDLPAIVEIYNASIATTTTWSDRTQTLAERAAWFLRRAEAGDGVLVAEHDQLVVGFGAYGEFRDNELWPGYRFTVENTVHVREGWQGSGIGRSLMEELARHATRHGKHVMIAAVSADNVGSIRFHESVGFRQVALLPEVGRKFDRWLDLVLLSKQLGDEERAGATRVVPRGSNGR